MTNKIDLDTLVLALAIIGRGDARDAANEYVRQVGHVKSPAHIVADVTSALIDLLDAKRARKNSTRNGTVQFEALPVVGMGATVCMYTDRHAATVVEVSPTGHKIKVREDKATRADGNGMSESQTYTYEPDPNGKEHVFYRQRNGRYVKLALCVRRSYHDYSF